MFALKVARDVTWVSKLIRFTLWKEKKGNQIQNASDFVSENNYNIVHIMSSFSFSF